MMTMSDGVSRTMRVRAWVTEYAATHGVAVSPQVLCETAVRRLGVTGATLTADASSGWPETRCATDALGPRLVELQVTVGEGPVLDAWSEGGPVMVADLDAPVSQQRWPLFAALAVDAGACALFALPMRVGTIKFGVFSLHRSAAGPLDPAAQWDSLAFAELAMRLQLDGQAGVDGAGVDGAVLDGAVLDGAVLDGADGFGLDLRSPHVHQATGMVSAQLDVTMEEAFVRLRARAFADQRSLADLAVDVVSRKLRFDPKDEAG
jgi:hypothetical protein